MHQSMVQYLCSPVLAAHWSTLGALIPLLDSRQACTPQPSQVPLSPDLKDIHTCLQEIKAKLNTLDDLVARVNVCTSSVNTLRSSVSDIAARVDNLSSDQHLLDRRLTVIEQSQSIATTSGAAASVSPPAPFLDVTRENSSY